MNGDKMDMQDKRNPEEGSRNNINRLDEIENNKQPGSEGEQHIFRNNVKDHLRITQYTVRLLQVSDRVRLPKLKENIKLIKLKEEIKGITEDVLE